MITKRIIPCLDVKNGRVVKGVNFLNLADVSSPVSLAKYYSENGADELVFYDITASAEGRALFTDVLREVASTIFIPLTVGGGISTIDDFSSLLRAGADKVSVNSAALKNPQLIADAADKFGSQCVVVAIDAKKMEDGSWHAFVAGGRKDTGIDAVEWAKKACELGAGEILLTSMDTDGTKNGFDLELLNAVTSVVHVPVIASGGCGNLEHFAEVFEKSGADAALAASLFHYRELTVGQVKEYLRDRHIPVRL